MRRFAIAVLVAVAVFQSACTHETAAPAPLSPECQQWQSQYVVVSRMSDWRAVQPGLLKSRPDPCPIPSLLLFFGDNVLEPGSKRAVGHVGTVVALRHN